MQVFQCGPKFERPARAGRQNSLTYREAPRQSLPAPAPEAGPGVAASTRRPQSRQSGNRRKQTSPAPGPLQTKTTSAERLADPVPAEKTDERLGSAIRQPAPAQRWQ